MEAMIATGVAKSGVDKINGVANSISPAMGVIRR